MTQRQPSMLTVMSDLPTADAIHVRRTLADAGVPLSRIARMLEADPSSFAEAIRGIDEHLRDEIERLEHSRKQIAQLAVGDGLALPPEVVAYLDRLREIGVSDRMVNAERDGWILVMARWPDRVREAGGDDLPFDLLDALSIEYDPRALRLMDLMRERGWDGWTRMERLPDGP
jgi:hypothetical protein